MKVFFTRRAEQDLSDICDYIRSQNPPAAKQVSDSVIRAVRNLASFPYLGRLQSVPGLRKLVTTRYPYLIYYIIDETAEEVLIVAIQHPARERNEFEAG